MAALEYQYMQTREEYDIAIIGGGFYGCYLASALAAGGMSTVLLEAEADLMTRASYNNQARVHAGYHYPRNFNTGRRAQALMPLFVDEFKAAIRTDFTAVYAVSQNHSKITAKMFEEVTKAMGAELRPADAHLTSLFAPGSIEQSYCVSEPVFDATVLRRLVRQRLEDAGATIQTGSPVTRVKKSAAAQFTLTVGGESQRQVRAGQVYLCAYSALNSVLRASGLPAVSLSHQWTEICLVKLPPALADFGFTVVDGPFFSLLPFPDRGCHSLTHVQFTPHRSWQDEEGSLPVNPGDLPRTSAFLKMQKDALRWLPQLEEAKYLGSLWEIKTLLPKNSENDGRPILRIMDYHEKGLHLILGSKIDNVLELTEGMAPAARKTS